MVATWLGRESRAKAGRADGRWQAADGMPAGCPGESAPCDVGWQMAIGWASVEDSRVRPAVQVQS